MADLLPGGQPARAQNGGSRAGPVPVSTHPTSGVRTPTDVMRARRDREARRKAEQEALLREREEEEARVQEAQSADTGNIAGQGRRQPQYPRGAGGSQTAGSSTRRPPENLPAQAGTTQQAAAASQQPRSATRYQQPNVEEEPADSRRTRAPRPSKSDVPPSTVVPMPAQPEASTQPSQQQPAQRSGFPHAFERWETLSSHWEGLTSYWIRRLQENSNELSNNSLSQQMSRQITDLSAAGANLFHAVVELQRLRASSERKFQRWFFETRAEQERSREAQAELQRQLQEERQRQTEVTGSISSARAERIKAEELVKEMRRELQISKEEARRAWEELGRREQEERDRTTSLRNGEPTLVGGVQVVPMTQGSSARHPTSTQRPATREGAYAGGPVGQSPVQPQSRRGPNQGGREEPEQGYYEQPSVSSGEPSPERAPSEIPYYGQQRMQPASSRAPPSEPSSSRGYGQASSLAEGRIYPQSSADTAIHESTTNGQSTTTPAQAGVHTAYPSGSASEDYGEEEYAYDENGNIRRDSRGRPIIYQAPRSDEGSDDYEGEQIRAEEGYSQQYTTPSSSRPTTSATARPTTATYDPYPATATTSAAAQPSTSAADYSGQGWGVPSTGWEAITPRHRHPTRLSDVLEEDERSRRTSPSRGSMVSGGDRAVR